MRQRICRIDVQTLGQASGLRISGLVRRSGTDIVEAETALYAQPVFIGRSTAAVTKRYGLAGLLILAYCRYLAADAAIRADDFDLAIRLAAATALCINDGCRHQRACRAGLDTFAARHTG